MQPPAVTLEECSKRFGERLALRKATLAVEPGETVVLLGPNGAGKSTLLRLAAGLLRPTAGHARIDGVDAAAAPRALRAGMAYAGHRSQLYRGLTARSARPTAASDASRSSARPCRRAWSARFSRAVRPR